MQILYPVEKAIRPGCPLSIGGQGQELRYVSGLYMPAHGVLADAIFPRYAAIRALPGRQKLLDSKALLVRANGTDPTQLLLLIHAAAPVLLRARPLVHRDGLPGPRREARGSLAPTPARALAWVASQRSPGLLVWRPGLPELVFAPLAHF